MNVDRFSVTMDPELGHAVRDAARRSGISVSAWVAQATADKLRNDLLGAALVSPCSICAPLPSVRLCPLLPVAVTLPTEKSTWAAGAPYPFTG